MSEGGKSALAAGGILASALGFCAKSADDVARVAAAGGDDLVRVTARASDDVLGVGAGAADDVAQRLGRGANGLPRGAPRPRFAPAVHAEALAVGDDVGRTWIADVADLGIDGVQLAYEVLGPDGDDDAAAWAEVSRAAETPADLALVAPRTRAEFRAIYGHPDRGEMLEFHMLAVRRTVLGTSDALRAWIDARPEDATRAAVVAVARFDDAGAPEILLPDGTTVSGAQVEAWCRARGLTLLLAAPPDAAPGAHARAFVRTVRAVRAVRGQ